jgi:hypothetical protein
MPNRSVWRAREQGQDEQDEQQLRGDDQQLPQGNLEGHPGKDEQGKQWSNQNPAEYTYYAAGTGLSRAYDG